MNSMQSEKNKDEHLKKKNINSAEAGSQPSYQKRMNVLSKCYCHLVYELILSFSMSTSSSSFTRMLSVVVTCNGVIKRLTEFSSTEPY